VFDKTLEKLWIHGGAVIDYAENVSRGQDGWRELYIAQSEQKQHQLDLMLRFAESSECRMSAMVRHFGDHADSRKPCGICDFCAPDQCAGQRFRAATANEQEAARRMIAALRGAGYRPTGRLFTELFADGSMVRDGFEDVIGALARAGLVRLTSAVFEKDGKSIPYSKASLTAAGEELDPDQPLELQITMAAESVSRKRKSKKGAKKTAKRAKKPESLPVKAAAKPPAAAIDRLEEALRNWRLEEARRRGVPAFRIFTDAALRAMAEKRPTTTSELLGIPGIGISTVEKYGAQIYRLMARHEFRG